MKKISKVFYGPGRFIWEWTSDLTIVVAQVSAEGELNDTIHPQGQWISVQTPGQYILAGDHNENITLYKVG